MCNESSLPTVIIPFQPPDDDFVGLDVFVYLRPETNGVITESTLLGVIEKHPEYKANVQLAYLANIPGEFITRERIIEYHYIYKLPFAKHGKKHFTPYMKVRFEERFGIPFADARILGAFEALDLLDMDSEAMFHTWVDESDLLNVDCQSIKRVGEVFIVNYDIPAILERYQAGTDIAVMIFRSTLSRDAFHGMIGEMEHCLRECGILDRNTPSSRAFHYSRGPFEQIRDARGHLFNPNGAPVDMRQLQFCKFLLSRGVRCPEIEKALHFPIMRFKTPDGSIVEDCLYNYTYDDSYEEAYRKFSSAISQYIIG